MAPLANYQTQKATSVEFIAGRFFGRLLVCSVGCDCLFLLVATPQRSLLSNELPHDFDPCPINVQHHAGTVMEDTRSRVTATFGTIPKEIAASHDVENASDSMLASSGSSSSTDIQVSLQVATPSIPGNPTTTKPKDSRQAVCQFQTTVAGGPFFRVSSSPAANLLCRLPTSHAGARLEF